MESKDKNFISLDEETYSVGSQAEALESVTGPSGVPDLFRRRDSLRRTPPGEARPTRTPETKEAMSSKLLKVSAAGSDIRKDDIPGISPVSDPVGDGDVGAEASQAQKKRK